MSCPENSLQKHCDASRMSNYGQFFLIWETIYSNMGSHIVKTTIEIADDLFKRTQKLARERKTTFRALAEQGLRLVLSEKKSSPGKLPPLVTVGSGGLRDEFKSASWEKVLDESYRGRGA